MATSEPIEVRRAKPDDVAEIAAIHVRSWQAAYKGVLPEDLLAGLSVKEREESWRRLLSGNEHHWLNLIAEDDRGPLGFCAVAGLGKRHRLTTGAEVAVLTSVLGHRLSGLRTALRAGDDRLVAHPSVLADAALLNAGTSEHGTQ